MLGQQTETLADIQDTIKLAVALDPSYVHFTIFCPYPGTAAYSEGVKSGIIKKDVWQEFAANPTEDFELPFWEEHFTAEELRELLVKAYKGFYLRPAYIVKRIARIRSMGEFKRKMKAGLSVFTMKSKQRLAIKAKARDIVPLANYDVHS